MADKKRTTRSKTLITDCDKIKQVSQYVRNWVNKQQNVKEESITDWLLYEISEKIDGITYHAFTRNEEAKMTGADWEWWFIFRQCSYRYRVQAKKIKSDNDNYSLIAYTNKYGLQIEKLIEDSRSSNSIPIYAFYTKDVDRVRCGKHIIDEGVYITGAQGLFNKFILTGKRQTKYDDILEDTIPLSCMLCCPLARGNDSRSRYDEFIKNYFVSEQIELNDMLIGRYEELPSYVSNLMKISKGKMPDWWEREFQSSIQNINGILIIDRRDKRDPDELIL